MHIKQRRLVVPILLFALFLTLLPISPTHAEDSAAPEPTVLFEDDASSLSAAGWSVDDPDDGAYITDHANTTGNPNQAAMKPVPEGQYLLYGDEVGSINDRYKGMTKELSIGSGPWALEFDARIDDLAEIEQIPGVTIWRGLSFEVIAAFQQYKISFQKDKIMVMTNASSGSYLEAPIPPIANDEFHHWGIAYDGSGKLLVVLDGLKVAAFPGISVARPDLPDSINIMDIPLDWKSGTIEVYLDRIKLTNGALPEWAQYDPHIGGLSILPVSSSAGVNLAVQLAQMPPGWIGAGNVSVSAKLYQGQELVAETSALANSTGLELQLDAQGRTGMLKTVVTLLYGNRQIDEVDRGMFIDSTVTRIAADDRVDSQPNQTFLFTDVASMTNGNKGSKKKNAAESGWQTASYRFRGTTGDSIAIENGPNAQALTLPLKLKGWFAIYVGYVTGTESFKASVHKDEKTIDFEGGQIVPGHEYGSQLLGERFVMAAKMNGKELVIAPVAGKKARIAYVKLKSLTNDAVNLYVSPNEGTNGKRVIYNNDGYSDFYEGYYPNAEALKLSAVNRYEGKDVGQIDWGLLTTFTLNHASQYAGIPFDGSEQYEAQMRDGDKVARQSILDINAAGKSPLQIVAERAGELGMKVNASFRMNAVYDPQSDGYLNGKVYDEQMQPYRVVDKDGDVKFEVDYGYQIVRDYVKNVLVEASSFPGVDGVNLDFNRYPYTFGYQSELTEAYKMQYGIEPKDETSEAGNARWNQYKADAITQLLRELRTAIPSGKQISVRFPHQGYLEYGFDIQQWVSERLVDVLIPASISYEDFYDIAPFVNLVRNTGIRLYAGINADLAGSDLTKEEEDLIKQGISLNKVSQYLNALQYRVRTYELYQAGADGIYIFNNWKGNGSLGNLGDKVELDKWHYFGYPADLVQSSIEIQSTP
ncbi:family 10 glycosylhydrolase [Paenibacillus sp. GCM10027626]|uniref:family 10 glycosylhydrolase n=1 Tax=Paenibacillus sp. GCM10027626 TaxID=3273411 RepID=UPI003632341B